MEFKLNMARICGRSPLRQTRSALYAVIAVAAIVILLRFKIEKLRSRKTPSLRDLLLNKALIHKRHQRLTSTEKGEKNQLVHSTVFHQRQRADVKDMMTNQEN
ncbi:uncharacterized protein LOC106162514 [Lingula anatina]|uniref:Uncharacterized protein LOC106162514 n=1 Tax=Lingula anatina TaxID=7574 RepID=A0A1S3ICV8_LINAN|nr:uncharacterized protein LOC106162514 [Lingula anatina]|eukprot:XP_013395274.1 uncharacterized protein LOC106162514 [Lingula anatina]